MAADAQAPEELPHDVRTVSNDESMQELLDLLDDAACRAILDGTGERALAASEVSEACELPLSTTYRKLDLLTEAGLLEERTRIRRSGKHASEYARTISDVVVSMGSDGGTTLKVAYREPAEPMRLERRN